jgi:hypothetical protein
LPAHPDGPEPAATPALPDAPAALPAPGATAANAVRSPALQELIEGFRLDSVVRRIPFASLMSMGLPPHLTDHLNERDHPFVTVIVDFTLTHPGASGSLAATARADSAFNEPDTVGNLAVQGKCDKYLAAAKEHDYVLLPFHVSPFGRVHPIAQKFLDFLCARATARALTTPLSSSLPLDPEMRGLILKRTQMRALSTSVQRSLALGLLQAAQRVVCPARNVHPVTTAHTFDQSAA